MLRLLGNRDVRAMRLVRMRSESSAWQQTTNSLCSTPIGTQSTNPRNVEHRKVRRTQQHIALASRARCFYMTPGGVIGWNKTKQTSHPGSCAEALIVADCQERNQAVIEDVSLSRPYQARGKRLSIQANFARNDGEWHGHPGGQERDRRAQRCSRTSVQRRSVPAGGCTWQLRPLGAWWA